MKRDASVSRTLKKTLTSRAARGGTSKSVERNISTGYFWARFYHDGRKPIDLTERPGKFLAFWKSVPKARDPRLLGGQFPKTRSAVRGLRGSMSDSAFRAAVKSGELILTKKVKGWKGNRFMPRAFRKVTRDPFINKKMEDSVEKDITRMLDPFMGTSEKKPFREKKIFVRLKRP